MTSRAPDKAYAAAMDALMEALEDWAASLGELGYKRADDARYYPSRSMTSLRRAHERGELLEKTTGWLEQYRYRPDGASRRMRDIVEHGLPVWEHLVAETGQPWSPYVTDRHREILQRVIDDVSDEIERGQRLRAQMHADWLVWKAESEQESER